MGVQRGELLFYLHNQKNQRQTHRAPRYCTFRPYKHTPMHVEVRHGQSKENARFKPRALGGDRKPWSPAICAIKEISAACTGRRDIAILVKRAIDYMRIGPESSMRKDRCRLFRIPNCTCSCDRCAAMHAVLRVTQARQRNTHNVPFISVGSGSKLFFDDVSETLSIRNVVKKRGHPFRGRSKPIEFRVPAFMKFEKFLQIDRKSTRLQGLIFSIAVD